MVKIWNTSAVIILVALSCIVMPAAASVYYSSSVSQIITKGDSFTISGTGTKDGPVAIWIFGRNFFDVKTAIPERNGNFTLTIKPDETRKFSSGKYAVGTPGSRSGQTNADRVR